MKRLRIIIASLMTLTMLSGCAIVEMFTELATKESITNERFVELAESNFMEVQDQTDNAKESIGEDKVSACSLAIYNFTTDDGEAHAFGIEFYEFTDDIYAVDYYAEMAEEFERRYESLSSKYKFTASGQNYNTWQGTSERSWSIVSRVDNTCIFIDILNADYTPANEFVKSIGYY